MGDQADAEAAAAATDREPESAHRSPAARGDPTGPEPDLTGEELDIGWGEPPGEREDDERLLRERPPHWE